MNLQADVFGCHDCRAAVYGFERAANTDGYFKFPATIGARDTATLLFVGINPYRDDRNRRLYPEAMASLDAFNTLASNHEPRPESTDTPRYIRRYHDGERPRYGREPYYRWYMDVIEGVWGHGTPFEAHAAATELYLCSTTDTTNGAFISASPCAAKYFARTFAQVRPEAVVTFGRAPRDYMREQYALKPVTRATLSPYLASIDGHEAWVFDIPHNQAHVTGEVRAGAIRHAVDGIGNIVHHQRDPERVPISQLFPPRKSQRQARSAAASPSDADVAAARERLAAGQAYSDGRIYGIYQPGRPDFRPQYGAYLAAWAIRQALGYDKTTVRIKTEAAGGGYRFRIIPVRAL